MTRPKLEFTDAPDIPRVTLNPGMFYVTAKTELITTLLGSCVSVCLQDKEAGISGMNHFLLANQRYARNMPASITEAGRYGIHAMEVLINSMIQKGAKRSRLRAKAFGGGNVIKAFANDNFNCVGEVNSRFVKEFLVTEKIPIDAEDLGGTDGRVIAFRTDTFKVYRRFIQKSASIEIEKDEHSLWEKEIKHRDAEKDDGSVILFN